MNSYEQPTHPDDLPEATATGPIEGHPPNPDDQARQDVEVLETKLDEALDKARRLQIENQKLHQEMSGLEFRLNGSIEDRRTLLRSLDYLGRVAGGFDADHVVEDMPAKDDDHQAVLVAGHDDLDTWHRVEFHKQGPVAVAAAQMRLVHAQLAQARAEMADGDEVVDAEIQDYVPEWAETVDIANLGMVGATGEGVLSLQNGGPWSPSQAMVTAAWIYSMADMNLEDGEAGFDHLVERVRNT